MSIKKKVGISDLLRDEAQKEPEVIANNLSFDVTTPNPEKTIEIKAETVSEPIALVSSKSSINAQEQEKKRSQLLADLQKDLQFSRTNVELLQKSLAVTESFKNELEQQLVAVKRDNLRLAEANIQLSEQIKSWESKKETLPTPPPEDIKSSSQLIPQNNRATPRKQPVEQPYTHRDRNSYARPTGSNEQLQRINNKNIGWMD